MSHNTLKDVPQLASVAPKEEKTILLTYVTGEQRIFDVSPYIKGFWFGELADQEYFRLVQIEPTYREWVVWPHGQDIAPHELYDLSTAVE